MGNSAFSAYIPTEASTTSEASSDAPAAIGTEQPATPANAQPADSVKVKKTSYPQDTHSEEYSLDLRDPDNIKPDTAVYDTKSGKYKVGTMLGDNFLGQPWMMEPDEYLKWSERKRFMDYFKMRNDSLFTTKGKNKFDFTDMHFDLGPAEKIFGPGGVQIKTRGSAELKFGYNYSFTDNPSLSERNRTNKAFDFDEKVNMDMSAKIGDKMDFKLKYQTEATFDYDAQNLKLAYEGKEDEIVKLLEAGYVTFPTNSSLIKGSSALFGIRTDLQFGKLNLQTIVSQKKSQSKTVGSKGGSQLEQFEIQAYNYEENRHFFLAQYFHDTYDKACSTLPNITSGVTINRIEIWVTNTGGATENTRNIIGFVDLGERNKISNPLWNATGPAFPSNESNDLYSSMVTTYVNARNVDQTSLTLDKFLTGGIDYEKVENARLLSSSEYTLNQHLGYISLNTLQSNQVLAVAYEYTYGGQTYQVGEFSADQKDNDKALFVKLLKNTNNSPRMGNWDLMMKNVYSLNSRQLQKEKFKLDIKYLCDTTGVYLNYIPEPAFKETTLLRMLNLDRLDENGKTNPNGKFDYIDGYTVQSATCRIIFPVVEPFGDWLRHKIADDDIADKYCYDELYDSTKTTAKQIAEKNKFILTGEYKASGGNTISLGQGNVARGSVVVTAGGVTLVENTDYTVNYYDGEVTIINQSIIDAGTSVNVSLENNDEYSEMRKTMYGLNWEYDFTKNFNIGGTYMHVNEKPLTSKVAMGSEPLNNTIWGLHMNWKQQSQWLTNLIDKLPFLNASAPSNISFTGEYAKLDANTASGTQGNASYIDDFENTKAPIDQSSPKEWVLSSTPAHTQFGNLSNDVRYGQNRALLAWYNIDPLFTRRASSLTPSHIKSDLNQLSNHYIREVYTREVYPNRDTNTGENNTLSILNVAYYPEERGPYNLDTDIDSIGRLKDPKKRWGGMMRKIDTSDFETSNIQYIEFWMLDPFIYTKDSLNFGGDFYINLGDISEDVLKDGKKSYESGMPVTNAATYSETVWGRVPNEKSVVYSFSNESGAREKQDIGINGLADAEEREFGTYKDYLNAIESKVDSKTFERIKNDPAGDDYHYFRGGDYDSLKLSVLDRYKRINMPEGNSPNASGSSYSTAYKSSPDAEDVNSDYTMNEYENFFEYHLNIRPNEMRIGNNYIVDQREQQIPLRNGEKETVTWYQFRIPIESYESKIGTISDYSSIRFMRMYLTGFEKPIVLRFANLDLVRGEWRSYTQTLFTGDKPSVSGTIVPSAVNIEENNDKSPVNYVLPPGITRILDPSQPQLQQQNEQALALTVENLASGDARAVYKTTRLDLRHYKHLQMFVHANALEGDNELQDNQMSIFVRMGSDYKSNYYEYEIPLTLTPAGHYDTYTAQGCKAVWPESNMLDIDFSIFTDLKHERNKQKALGAASYTQLFYKYDDDNPNNKVSIIGNPSLGEVKTMMIGIRNNGRKTGSVEVWVNELRMQDYSNEGGWAAQGNLNVQLSDIGSINMTGHVETAGFGGLEEGVNERRDDNLYEWSITTQFELGKLFPEKWKMSLPLYYSYSWQKLSPKYNPFDTDMLLSDAFSECETQAAKDSLKSLTESIVKNKNFSLSNWKSGYQSIKPLPIDPANFAFSYSYSQKYKTGETVMYENEENWKFNMSYNYSPKFKAWEPFKKLKGKSKWLDIVKAQNLQWLPQNLSFNTDITRNYYEFQERDIDSGTKLPVTFSEQFLWNRDLTVKWDIFKALKMSWTSSTHAEIEEPYCVVNKDLYPDEYSMWKDSVKRSLASFGRPLTYKSSFTGSYQVPLNKIPILDWVTADASYSSNYNWTRGQELEDGTSLGNTIVSNRTMNVNGKINMETLYKKWKFLADTEKRFSNNKKNNNSSSSKNSKDDKKTKTSKKEQSEESADNPDKKNADKNAPKSKATASSKKKKGFTKEVTLNDSTSTQIKHGQNSSRIIVKATTIEGKTYNLRYSKVDANTIKIKNRDTIPVKISVTTKEPLDKLSWYKTAQVIARGMMSLRNISLSYRNTYALTLPGFRTEVGDAFGQKGINGMLSPGLDFAFGAISDDYISKAARNGWLMQNDSNITTPASSATMEDLQLKATIEPFKDFKIDVSASRTVNKTQSVQFMYAGMPRTQSGSFNMTIISASSAFDTGGNINNNYHSKYFKKFLDNMPVIQSRLEKKYEATTYPAAAGQAWEGKPYNKENGGVDLYSADVMIPAFLSAYCGGNAISTPLDIFPAFARMMPNWSVKYSGITKMVPWFGQHFKSFNINHGYKSVFNIGAYNSYSSFMEYMGDMGFVKDVTTGNPVPSSMYNVSTVSINESFAPLIGVDMTFLSGMTAKLEYKKTRTLNLSMTSVALTENFSNDIVIGMGYKIKDLNLFGAKSIQSPEAKKKAAKSKNGKKNEEEETSSKSNSSKSRTTGISHDLNIRADFSYRMQNALNRNIQTAVTTATSGSTAYKLAVTADYTFSKLLTLSGFLDWQKNIPLVSQSSYPTTTADFGVSMKFSLTR